MATDGLLYLDGAAATAAQASLTVDQGAGTVVIAITDNATAALGMTYTTYVYDLKVLLSDGSTQQLTTGTAKKRYRE